MSVEDFTGACKLRAERLANAGAKMKGERRLRGKHGVYIES